MIPDAINFKDIEKVIRLLNETLHDCPIAEIDKKLKNGIRVIANKLNTYKSICIGVWVKTGSACETEEENGLSHFIEHMLFKGTERRTARQIAYEVDSIGGNINAFTSKECILAKSCK